MFQGLYKPSKWQSEFHALPHREALGAGSAGPGKTLCLIMDPIYQVVEEHRRCEDKSHPHHQPFGSSTGWALHLRRTRTMLDQTIAITKRIFPRIDRAARYDGATYMWIFSSGYRYQFGHCRDSDSWEQYFSNQYSYIGYDELVQFEEEQYHQINGRLRSTDPVLKHMLKIRAMSNPLMKVESGVSMKDPHWVRRRFVDPAPQGRVTLSRPVQRSDGTIDEVTRIYLPATLFDNPDPEFVRQYELELLTKPKHIRDAMLYGDWYVSPGSYFGDVWNSRLHVIRPFSIPEDWPQWRAMDWGFKQPGTVLWMAMDPDGNVIVHREYNFQGKTDREVAIDIRSIERELGLWGKGQSQITGVADTQLWEARGDNAMSKAQVMAGKGVLWLKADKGSGSRQRGAERIYKRLGDHHGETTSPGLVFFESCRMCIRTIPLIQGTFNSEEPVDGGEDHWFDALRYGVDFASYGAVGIPPRMTDDPDEDDELSRLPPGGMGRYGYGSPVL